MGFHKYISFIFIHHRLLSRLGLVSALVLLSSCGKIRGSVQNLHSDTGLNDFLKTEIISGANGIADGTTEMLIAIHLKNSDGSSVPDYKPTYEIVSGAGVTGSNCSTS